MHPFNRQLQEPPHLSDSIVLEKPQKELSILQLKNSNEFLARQLKSKESKYQTLLSKLDEIISNQQQCNKIAKEIQLEVQQEITARSSGRSRLRQEKSKEKRIQKADGALDCGNQLKKSLVNVKNSIQKLGEVRVKPCLKCSEIKQSYEAKILSLNSIIKDQREKNLELEQEFCREINKQRSQKSRINEFIRTQKARLEQYKNTPRREN